MARRFTTQLDDVLTQIRFNEVVSLADQVIIELEFFRHHGFGLDDVLGADRLA